MFSPNNEIIVIGAGVVGLTTALTLKRSGYSVSRIYTDRKVDSTTSSVAAALWFPYKALPLEKVYSWSYKSLDTFYSLCRVPESGVDMAKGKAVFRIPAQVEIWNEIGLPGEDLDQDEIPEGCIGGVTFEVPRIDMKLYLPYLVSQLQALGVEIVQEKVEEISQLSEDSLIINCSGMGSKQLFDDGEMIPIRGQMYEVEPVDGMGDFYFDDCHPQGLFYMVQRRESIMIGGTVEDFDTNETVCDETREAIKRRFQDSFPNVDDLPIVKDWVGIRPGRSSVRLGWDSALNVIHNYGHGGSGVTMSWGCAEEVKEILSSSSEAE